MTGQRKQVVDSLEARPQTEDDDDDEEMSSVADNNIVFIEGNENISSQPFNNDSRSRWVGRNHQFQVGDIIDILDSTSHWCEGQVMKLDFQRHAIFVSYLYWDNKHDEWITDIEEKTAPLNKHTYIAGGILKVGQRVEALDEKNKWLHSTLIDASEKQVKIHYQGFHPKYDEWIDRNSDRIRPFRRVVQKNQQGSSKSRVWRVPGQPLATININNRTDNSSNSKNFNNEDDHYTHGESKNNYKIDNNQENNENSDDRIRQIAEISNQYRNYMNTLATQNLIVFSVPGDGNCLFRSVAHQVYGDHNLHWLVREKCMDYMEADAQFFSQFVEGGMSTFHLYIQAKRLNACWGDDPEIQALCELYDRPADIWAYDHKFGARKLRTFHEAAGNGSRSSHRPPMRLSYYGGGHYDSVIDPQFQVHLISRPPGLIEDAAISRLREHHTRVRSLVSTSSSSSSTSAVDQAFLTSDLEAADREALEITLQHSRNDLTWVAEDLETCLALSMDEAAKQMNIEIPKGNESLTNLKEFSGQSLGGNASKISSDIIATQAEILNKVAFDSEREFIEKAIISSLSNEADITEAQLVEQALKDSSVGMVIPNAVIVDSLEQNDMDLALNLSNLSEEEAFDLAMKQSIMAYERKETPKRATLNAEEATQSKKFNTEQASGKWDNATEEEILRAALDASMEGHFDDSNSLSTSFIPDFDEFEDEDEMLRRAIAESLK